MARRGGGDGDRPRPPPHPHARRRGDRLRRAGACRRRAGRRGRPCRGRRIPACPCCAPWRMRRRCAPGLRGGWRHLAILGGGFIGLEVAAAARLLGVAVTVIEAAERLCPRALPPMLSAWLQARHASGGHAHPAWRSCHCRLADRHYPRRWQPASRPMPSCSPLAWRRTTGWRGRPGCPVRPRAAFWPMPPAAPMIRRCSPSAMWWLGSAPGGPPIRLESWAQANAMGQAAARAILGLPDAPVPLPWFWSTQGKTLIQMAGLAEDDDSRCVQRGDPASGSFLLFSDVRATYRPGHRGEQQPRFPAGAGGWWNAASSCPRRRSLIRLSPQRGAAMTPLPIFLAGRWVHGRGEPIDPASRTMARSIAVVAAASAADAEEAIERAARAQRNSGWATALPRRARAGAAEDRRRAGGRGGGHRPHPDAGYRQDAGEKPAPSSPPPPAPSASSPPPPRRMRRSITSPAGPM